MFYSKYLLVRDTPLWLSVFFSVYLFILIGVKPAISEKLRSYLLCSSSQVHLSICGVRLTNHLSIKMKCILGKINNSDATVSSLRDVLRLCSVG